MKLNPDCVRDILIFLEEAEFGDTFLVDDIYARLDSYEKKSVHYTCLKMLEGNLINADLMHNEIDKKRIYHIGDITYDGHQFLANIREEKVWNGVKKIAATVGSSSISAIVQIAAHTVTTLIKSQFGLPV